MLEEICTAKQIKGMRGGEVPWERERGKGQCEKGIREELLPGCRCAGHGEGKERNKASAPTNLPNRCHHAAVEDKGAVWIRCSSLLAAYSTADWLKAAQFSSLADRDEEGWPGTNASQICPTPFAFCPRRGGRSGVQLLRQIGGGGRVLPWPGSKEKTGGGVENSKRDARERRTGMGVGRRGAASRVSTAIPRLPRTPSGPSTTGKPGIAVPADEGHAATPVLSTGGRTE
jgi:hypothetical protein